MNEWLTLTEALSRTMRTHAPGWTDRGGADPGITMLEILASLAESLQFHRGAVASGSPTASRISGRASSPAACSRLTTSLKSSRTIAKSTDATVGTPSPATVALYYAERPVDPLPTGMAQAMEPGRIEEGTRIVIAGSGSDGVTIAQIICDGDGWQVDESFAPVRSR